ncbi:MAG: hypothetical protein ACLQU3_05245 [Limisphaerales bacterium]
MENPPLIAPPARKRRNRNWLYILLALTAPFVAVALLFYPAVAKPPKESRLLQSFQKNRAAFEQLRDMLTADTNVRRVADWGIATRKPYFIGEPAAVNFPMDRYQQYRALLRQVGGKVAFRSDGEPANISVCVWVGGHFGAHTDIEVSWMGKAPTNQVNNLDRCRRPGPSGDRQYYYRHIDESWYLSTDMRPF